MDTPPAILNNYSYYTLFPLNLTITHTLCFNRIK